MSTTPANINATPKARFLESSDNAAKHRDLVDSREFQRGCDFAMLEMSRSLSESTNNAQDAIPAALMLRGAHEFLEIFRRLSEKPIDPPVPPPARNLNYNAR